MTKGIKFLLIAVFVSLPFWYGINLFQQNLEKFFYSQISQPFEEMVFAKIPPKPPKPKLDLQVKAAISVKINKAGKDYNPPTTLPLSRAPKILFKQNINQPLPIASLTKLMTAVISLENFGNDNLSRKVIVSPKAASQENVPPVKAINLTARQVITIGELLDRMLIYSVNDAAFALAEAVEAENGGNFVPKMNQKAKDLELENTNFVNPTGLDPENLHFSKENSNYFNRSTTKDLSKLAQYILDKFPFIYEISIGKPYYQIKNGFSDLSLNMNIIGEKTGYTDEAGGCLILILGDEKKYIINIVLGAPSSAARIEEMQKLINWIEK